jgi:hypothetical protein
LREDTEYDKSVSKENCGSKNFWEESIRDCNLHCPDRAFRSNFSLAAGGPVPLQTWYVYDAPDKRVVKSTTPKASVLFL